jgi:hypothetical protein
MAGVKTQLACATLFWLSVVSLSRLHIEHARKLIDEGQRREDVADLSQRQPRDPLAGACRLTCNFSPMEE